MRELLAAIRKAPDDDAPRLIYADWLQDHGDEARAEFIRVQCELARIPVPEETTQGYVGEFDIRNHCRNCRKLLGEYCRFHVLCRRERELRKRNWSDWIDDNIISFTSGWEFRRGFIDSITCTWDDCRHRLDTIREEHPVQTVTLRTLPEVDRDWLGTGERGYRFRGREKHHPFIRITHGGNGTDNISRGPEVSEMLAAEWPGITFTLPATPAIGAILSATADSFLRRAYRYPSIS